MISVFLADDHDIIRRFVRGLLEEEAGLCVKGETGNGLDAAKLVAASTYVVRDSAVRELVPAIRTVIDSRADRCSHQKRQSDEECGKTLSRAKENTYGCFSNPETYEYFY